jgi:hypothetical protein
MQLHVGQGRIETLMTSGYLKSCRLGLVSFSPATETRGELMKEVLSPSNPPGGENAILGEDVTHLADISPQWSKSRNRNQERNE